MNRTLSSLHGGSLEITLTVPLNMSSEKTCVINPKLRLETNTYKETADVIHVTLQWQVRPRMANISLF